MSVRGAAPRPRFFLWMSLACLAVAITGFSTTFFIPLAHGRFHAPAVIHVHALLLFGWLLLFIAQASLIQRRRFLTHRRLGLLGALMCPAIAVSGIAVGLYATRRDLATGGGDFVLGQMVNVVIEMLLFAALVTAALLMRRDGESHKRLLLLATLSALGPAWLRFRHLLPAVPHPFVVFSLVADSVLLVAIARDLRAMGRVHPVYLWGGGAMVAVHMTELAAATSPLWVRLGGWMA